MDQKTLLTSLRKLNNKIADLSALHLKMQDQIKVLEEENRSLKADLETERKNLNKALSDVEFLSVSYRLADSPESVVSARRTISRLIRTIDSCITMINEE
ncbi:MAG: hypothetical protein J1E95_02710 [Muribaculaceae bacterium]|nr:hypothetical protein [Muribaculaceae bacterium]